MNLLFVVSSWIKLKVFIINMSMYDVIKQIFYDTSQILLNKMKSLKQIIEFFCLIIIEKKNSNGIK